MAQGRSNAAIAATLFLTEKAVVQHTSNIYDAPLPVDADDHRRVLAVIRYLEAAA
jgi:DNA-binding NarL/FixJ family response regulator